MHYKIIFNKIIHFLKKRHAGFTDLSEKYSKTGGGSSRLTQVLNDYIGGMVQEILSRNGDIFKFSGDAFLALWKITPSLSIPDAIHQALDSALMIQENLGVYRTDVGVIIKGLPKFVSSWAKN